MCFPATTHRALLTFTELDGFEARGNIKVLMATNRPDTLDPALMRPGRMDRKIEFGVPTLEVGSLLVIGWPIIVRRAEPRSSKSTLDH